MKIPTFEIKIPDYVLVEQALPAGYGIKGAEAPFTIHIRDNYVAQATVHDGLVVIELLGNDGLCREFAQKMAERYPNYDDERIVWQCFHKWLGSWTPTGNAICYATPEEALDSIVANDLPWGVVLCSFKLKDVNSDSFVSLTTQRLDLQMRLSNDLGPMLIEINHLENKNLE